MSLPAPQPQSSQNIFSWGGNKWPRWRIYTFVATRVSGRGFARGLFFKLVVKRWFTHLLPDGAANAMRSCRYPASLGAGWKLTVLGALTRRGRNRRNAIVEQEMSRQKAAKNSFERFGFAAV